jgi:hypothetical protein
VRSEVYLFVFYANFGSDVVPVEFYSFWRQIQHFGDFFGGFALAYEIGDLDLGGGQLHKRI